MEMVLNNDFCEMLQDEMLLVDGGVNWDRVFGGTTVFLGATLAVASMSTPIGWGVAGTYWAISAASGAYVGYGLAS